MRHIKIAYGLAVVVGALCVTAAPAFAETEPEKSFVASIPHKTISPEKPAHASGKTEEPQVFKFGTKYIIKCQQSPFPENRSFGPTLESKATIESEKLSEIEVGIKFLKCGRYATTGTEEFTPATIKGTVKIRYFINGSVETVGNGEGEELEYGKEPHVEFLESSMTIKVAPAKQCTIIIPTQVLPLKSIKHPDEEFSTAVYSEGESKKGRPALEIANEFKKMKYRFGEETQCGVESPKEQGNEGTYTGSLHLEIPTGSLSVEEGTL